MRNHSSFDDINKSNLNYHKIASIANSNCNNTMPVRNKPSSLLSEDNSLNSNQPSPNDCTLDINVYRYNNDDELNYSITNTQTITMNLMSKNEFRNINHPEDNNDININNIEVQKDESNTEEDNNINKEDITKVDNKGVKRPSIFNMVKKQNLIDEINTNINSNSSTYNETKGINLNKIINKS